jgi:hypothetical protein
MASGLLPSKLIVFPALNVKIKHYLLQIYSISGVEGEAKEEERERRIGRLPGIILLPQKWRGKDDEYKAAEEMNNNEWEIFFLLIMIMEGIIMTIESWRDKIWGKQI